MDVRRAIRRTGKRLVYKNWPGTCPICEKRVRFYVKGAWYRDQLECGSCYSIPRERALMKVVQTLYPNWRDLKIHESSPGGRGASVKLERESRDYTASQYIPSMPFGEVHPDGFVNQDLENQTFADESFDLVITQDVFEHIFHPDRAIREIARTLRPGGAHIMTVPIVNKASPATRRASLVDGEVTHYAEPQYHGNPVGDGALVTVDWGYDIADYLTFHSGLPTNLFTIDDLSAGIRAEYIEVVVSRKDQVPQLL